MQLHEVFADLSHSVLSVLDGLDLHYCLLLDNNSSNLFLVFFSLLLLDLHLLIAFFIGLFSLRLQQPILPTDHWIRRLQQLLIIFLFLLTALILVVFFSL